MQPSAGSRVVVGPIPAEPAGFLDRRELLDALLIPTIRQQVATVFAITGLRGVGKSQLAAACARQRLNEGWRVVAWLNASNRGLLLAGFGQLASAMGLVEEGQDSEKSAERVRHWLETDGNRCLLVIDDAIDADLIRPFLPVVGNSHVIVTSSRHALAGLGISVPVDVLTAEQAAAFLAERTGLTNEPGLLRIAEELGCLPLALAQAAAVIVGQRLDSTSYLHRLTAVSAADFLPRTEQDPYPIAAAEAIVLSLNAAEHSAAGSLPRQLLEVTSLLSPTGVPRTWLATPTEASVEVHRRGRFHLRGLQRVPRTAVDACLQVLTDASLLSWSADGSAVVSHRLVMRIVRERAWREGTLRTAASQTVCALQEALLEMLPSAKGQFWRNAHLLREQAWRHPDLVQEVIKQITALADHLDLYPDIVTGRLGRDLLHLRDWAGWYLAEVRDFSRAIPILQQVTADYEHRHLLRARHPAALRVRNELAYAYQAAGRLDEAVALSESILADGRRLFGRNDPETLTFLNDLALKYQEAGRPGEAIPLFEQALAGRLQRLGPTHPDTLGSRNNLAHAYHEVGRFGEAIPLFEQTLTDSKAISGPDHPSTLGIRTNLASAYRDVGRLDEAVAMFEGVLADGQLSLGAQHPDTLVFRSNLATVYADMGRLDEAITLNESVLADRERILGPGHPETLASRNNLAHSFQEVGRLSEAIRLFEQITADSERVLGPDHPAALASRSGLAGAYQAAGHLDEAISLLQQTLAERERILEPGHVDTQVSRLKLANVFKEADRPDEAIPLVKQVLSDISKILAPDHPAVLGLRSNLASAYCTAGRVSEARDISEQLLADCNRALGSDHEITRQVRRTLETTGHSEHE